MTTHPEAVRAPRSSLILWGWTGVSALLHVVLVGALCFVSYLGFTKREAASKSKQAAEEAAAKRTEADEAVKRASAPPPAAPTATAANEKPAAPPPPEPATTATAQPPSAERILGIDKTAKPGETPKSPFAGSDDDLLKDLK